MMKKTLLVSILVSTIAMVLVGLGGCSAEVKPKLAKGRCEINENCQPGERCENTWCEDIYHPRKEIKNY